MLAILAVLILQTPAPADQARAFLDALADIRARAIVPFEDDYRFLFRYTPASRRGVSFADMNEEQTEAARRLLKSTLSETGYLKIETIRALEDVLREIERSARRDRELYVFTVFGNPGETGFWGWRYEGHHLSLNFTYSGNKLISSTPQFLGAHPAITSDGTRALKDEETIAFDLLISLSQEQKAKAVVSAKAPRDVLTTNARTAAALEDRGLPYNEMTDEQKKALINLISVHAGIQNTPEKQRRMESVEQELGQIKFAWMGADRPGVGHYYRIQGKTFLIEFDNTQNRANHIHTVWRDFENDFGRDVLADHYRTHHYYGHAHAHGH